MKFAINGRVLPPHGGIRQRLELAAAAGFEGVELDSIADRAAADDTAAAAAAAGVRIHSVKTRQHVLHPLSSRDEIQVRRGIEETLLAIRNAKLWGADSMLLIPGTVTPSVSYAEARDRSHDVIRREILPAAAESGIVLTVENIWRSFILSPEDFVSYIDSFDSPWVQATLDVGNVVLGHPEHWVRALGPRIRKIHAKDFWLDPSRGRHGWPRLGEGGVSWPDVRAALAEFEFDGWVTNTEPMFGEIARWWRSATRRVGALAFLGQENQLLWALERPAVLRRLRLASQRVGHCLQ